MPRESSSAPTLEAGVPETSSHSSISSKFTSDLRIKVKVTVFVHQMHIIYGKFLPLSSLGFLKYSCFGDHQNC